jgi:hypothetical protein
VLPAGKKSSPYPSDQVPDGYQVSAPELPSLSPFEGHGCKQKNGSDPVNEQDRPVTGHCLKLRA